MTGRSKQDKRKRDAHAADLTQPPPPPGWVKHWEASKPEWDDEQTVPIPLPGSGQEAQVVQRIRRHPQSGRLVDFAVSVQIRDAGTDDGWCDVERVDCKHGYVHVDQGDTCGGSRKDESCIPPGVGDDLDKALTWALGYVWDIDDRLKGWA